MRVIVIGSGSTPPARERDQWDLIGDPWLAEQARFRSTIYGPGTGLRPTLDAEDAEALMACEDAAEAGDYMPLAAFLADLSDRYPFMREWAILHYCTTADQWSN